MPRIINAYADNSSLANSLKDLGEAMFGDQAKNEVYRQTAFGKKRENDNIPLLADAVARGDRDAIARLGVMSNKTGQDSADFNRLAVSNHASGVDDPRLALATMGAGGAFSSTAPGLGRELSNRSSIAAGNNATTLEAQRIASDRAAAVQQAIDNRTLTPVDDGNGGLIYMPKSQATGRGAPMSSDAVVANMLRKYTAQPPVQAADAGATPAAAPAAPSSPFSNVPPQIQKKIGVYMEPQSLIEPRSGITGISRDGGQTVTLPDGRTVPATGFQPVSNETALGQARDNNVRASAAQPLVVGDPSKGQAAADATQASGLGAKVQKVANEEVGALPGGAAILKAVTGSPEIAPATQRAQSQLDVRNNAARTVLLGAPGRQTVQAQKWVNDLLPQGDALANPATEAAKIPTIVNALKGDHEQYRQLAIDPNTLPAERVKAVQAMHQIENTIRLYTEPAAPAAGAPAPAQQPAAPTAGAQPAADPLAQARDAIAKGADPAAVAQRLRQHGIDPSGLAPQVPVSR
ncbi:hypothetical protein ABIE87_006447 [Bradyrhizobium diazoefficiens]|uniref:hypothetical protein n=1 Tax=Bradyrhizobium diazoefficiens TaxID=1355477 RepID=UPI003514F53D